MLRALQIGAGVATQLPETAGMLTQDLAECARL